MRLHKLERTKNKAHCVLVLLKLSILAEAFVVHQLRGLTVAITDMSEHPLKNSRGTDAGRLHALRPPPKYYPPLDAFSDGCPRLSDVRARWRLSTIIIVHPKT